MKTLAPNRSLASVAGSRSFTNRPSPRVAWLGLWVCTCGVACAPSDDAERRFDISTSHAEPDGKQTDGKNTDGSSGDEKHTSSDAGAGTTGTLAGNTKDVTSTASDDSADATDNKPSNDESNELTTDDTTDSSNDEGNDPTSDDSADTSNSVPRGSSADTTATGVSGRSDDDSDDESDAGNSSDQTSTNSTNTTSSPTTNDTATNTSEDTADDATDTTEGTTDTTDDSSDESDPLLSSDIAELVWVTGSLGTGPGLFDDARFLAADSDGNAYVAEFETNGPTRVQVFNPEGEFVRQWYTERESIVEGMAGTLDGQLYILQGGYVDRYNGADGSGMETMPIEDPFSTDAIAVAPDGGLVLVGSERIVRLAPDGTVVYDNEDIADVSTGSGFFNANGAAVDGSGNVFVIETFETTVFKFDYKLNLNTQLGVVGEGPGLLESWPESITTDRYGRIYVADWDGIEVFAPGGGYGGFIGLTGAIFAMAATINDELFVLERNDGKLFKLKLTQ